MPPRGKKPKTYVVFRGRCPGIFDSWEICKKRFPEEGDEFRRHEISRKEHEYLMTLKDHRFQTDLSLKVDAKVVLLHNLDIPNGLVNGTQGEVVKFVDTADWSHRKLEGKNGKWRSERVREFQRRNTWQPIVRFVTGAIRVFARTIIRSLLRLPNPVPLALAWALSIHKSQGMTFAVCRGQLEGHF